jgi:mRNA-degrading endonuclease RelE of RelBE toxin-antitoxin system
MSFSIVTVDSFEKELKHLAKKFPSIKKDIAKLTEQLLIAPMIGIPIGNDCYKIRMAITSKGKGKSGGARVITHIRVTKEYLYLLSIYDKSEAENISDDEVLKRLKKLY